jgi:5-formyltetrahydrofolate cyclo-ligase
MNKLSFRKTARMHRAALVREVPDFASRIAAAEFDLLPGAVVAGYAPIASEADPSDLMAALAGRGHSLALPCIAAADGPLVFRSWRPGEPRVLGAYDIEEPLPEAVEVRPDLILVPLLAFDREGWRLGYGGGYYDRTIAALRGHGALRTVGIAFAGQEVEALPHEGHDCRLDAVLTENGLRRF